MVCVICILCAWITQKSFSPSELVKYSWHIIHNLQNFAHMYYTRQVSPIRKWKILGTGHLISVLPEISSQSTVIMSFRKSSGFGFAAQCCCRVTLTVTLTDWVFVKSFRNYFLYSQWNLLFWFICKSEASSSSFFFLSRSIATCVVWKLGKGKRIQEPSTSLNLSLTITYIYCFQFVMGGGGGGGG